jgi:AcrR family transcriptional regulator
MASRRSAKTRVAKHKSQTVAQSVDPRIAKTRARIAEAFIQLIQRRPYYRMRVSDITRKAKIGRATFYAHFESKDALLKDRFGNIVRGLLVELKDEPCLVDCTPFFAHVLGGRQIYRSLTAGPGRAQTERILQDVLEARIAELIAAGAARGIAVAPTPGFVPRFVAGSILALIAWALEQVPPPSSEDMQSAYRTLVGRALAAGETTH